ncbi:YeeE/YedE thiosulfate transporter family protein [Proteinivorax tanatarense]|uniref:YeeE/YedE thiosulfate transporter family protein n=1 Tax=Proteinivorax tanatarense TaxID=1260629 RepID=A0AAU7VPM1_9FIRM
MTSSKIEQIKNKKQIEVYKRKSQTPYALILAIIITGISVYFFSANSSKLGVLLILGTAMGFIIQRSRLCFAGSIRNSIMLGNVKLLKSVVIALIVASFGFFILQYIAVGDSINIIVEQVPGQIKPVGIHTVIGAVIFGIGMVMAGACVSGSLIRSGEGFILQLMVILGIVVGTVLSGVVLFEFFDQTLNILSSPTIYLPKLIGFWPTLILQLAVLFLIYFFMNWYEKK